MPHPPARKGLARASLCLGFAGLLTAGGCGVGALVGLTLGIVALARGGHDPTLDTGRDVAWAGIVTNALGVLTIGPVMMLALMLSSGGEAHIGGDDELPAPHPVSRGDRLLLPVPPPASPSSAVASPAPATVEGGLPGEPVRVGGAIREPTKLRHVSPVYPDIAKQARVQGVVILEATISPAGKISDLRVLSGVPLLNEAAIEAVKQWEYTPTRLNGVPVPVIMTVTVRFRLQ